MEWTNRTDMFTPDERDYMYDHISDYLSSGRIRGVRVTALEVTFNHL